MVDEIKEGTILEGPFWREPVSAKSIMAVFLFLEVSEFDKFQEKEMLLRTVVEEKGDTRRVITVYKTSKIKKYWKRHVSEPQSFKYELKVSKAAGE